MSHQNSADSGCRFPQALQTTLGFFDAETTVNQQRLPLGFNQGSITLTTATQGGKTHIETT